MRANLSDQLHSCASTNIFFSFFSSLVWPARRHSQTSSINLLIYFNWFFVRPHNAIAVCTRPANTSTSSTIRYFVSSTSHCYSTSPSSRRFLPIAYFVSPTSYRQLLFYSSYRSSLANEILHRNCVRNENSFFAICWHYWNWCALMLSGRRTTANRTA